MRKPKKKTTRFPLDKWKELANYSPAELESTDIGLMNLICSLGLPGADDLDIPRCLEFLQRWRKRIQRETQRNQHHARHEAQRHGDSLEQWRVGMMITVLQQDCGVQYNPGLRGDYDFDFADAADIFIHGMIPYNGKEPPGGTCSSMPVLYVAMGRRLGFPLKLVCVGPHLLCAWVDPKQGKQFNIEGSSRGFLFPPDDHYDEFLKDKLRSEFTTPQRKPAKIGLRILNAQQELAMMLAHRGDCLMDNGLYEQSYEVFQAAVRFDPGYSHFLKLAEALTGRPTTDEWIIEAKHKLDKQRAAHKQRTQPCTFPN